MPDDTGWSGFTRRRLGVIAAAVAAVGIAGLVYAGPNLTSPAAVVTNAVQVPSMNGPFSATYDFLTPSLGWALIVDYSAYSTRFWLFRTDDGAGHWDRQYFGRAVGDRTYLHFFDENNGFAYAGRSYRTVDGGAHWLIVNVPRNTAYVTFATPNEGWAEAFAAGSKLIYQTSDGGRTWKLKGAAPPQSDVLQPLSENQSSPFLGDGEGWLGAAGQRTPTVFVTQDGGADWQPISLGPPSDADSYDTTVRLVGESAVVAFIWNKGRVLGALLSEDAGATWRDLFIPEPLAVSDDMTFVDSQDWWMFYSGSVYTTDNGGSSWHYVRSSGMPEGWNFAGPRAIDQRHAWWTLVSNAKSTLTALALTFDGGAHWNTVSMPQP